MKRLMIAITGIALGGISTSSLADDGNFFINADAGEANYHVGSPFGTTLYAFGNRLNDSDAAGALRFGYRWHSAVDYGFEAGYADMGRVSSAFQLPNGSSYQTNLKDRGWLLGGNLKYNIDSNWYVSARGGWFHARIDNKGAEVIYPTCFPGGVCPLNVAYRQYDYSQKGNGEYFGVGGGFNFSPNFSLGLSYDYYRSDRLNDSSSVDIGMYSLSAEYRF